jgi:N-acyl-phosphatidylethanolamine-hydrolysing phospholipase D
MNRSIKHYCNAHPHPPQRIFDLLRWRFGGGRGGSGRHESKTEDTFCRDVLELAPQVSASPVASARDSIPLTWIGHSTFLLQHLGRNILTDPILFDCQPLPVSSLRRLRPPGVNLHELPRIDDVLISHSHYDHLDAPSIKALGKAVQYWVPAGLSNWFDRRGIQTCSQLEWWESRSFVIGH